MDLISPSKQDEDDSDSSDSDDEETSKKEDKEMEDGDWEEDDDGEEDYEIYSKVIGSKWALSKGMIGAGWEGRYLYRSVLGSTLSFRGLFRIYSPLLISILFSISICTIGCERVVTERTGWAELVWAPYWNNNSARFVDLSETKATITITTFTTGGEVDTRKSFK